MAKGKRHRLMTFIVYVVQISGIETSPLIEAVCTLTPPVEAVQPPWTRQCAQPPGGRKAYPLLETVRLFGRGSAPPTPLGKAVQLLVEMHRRGFRSTWS